jgi:hypothetical protein
LGEYYSAVAESHANPDAEPDPIGFALGLAGVAWGVTDIDVCISARESDTVAMSFFFGAQPSRPCGGQASRLSNTLTKISQARRPRAAQARGPCSVDSTS